MECTKDVSDSLKSWPVLTSIKAITLTGFNLEVAAAAGNAGFNTWNHKALYDLIWAMKRVTLRHCHGPNAATPPKDPYYPDRYRPSGLGDSTSKKRRAPGTEPSTTLSANIKPKAMSLRPNFRKFRYTNGKKKLDPRAAPYQANTSFGGKGTRDNPVDLLLEEVDNGTQAKRLKLNSGNTNDTKLDQAGRGTDANNTPRKPSGITQQADIVSFMDVDLTQQDKVLGTKPMSPSLSPPASKTRGFAAVLSVSPLQRELDLVRKKLQYATESMISSRRIMKRVFDKDGDLLKLKETMPSLNVLSTCLLIAEQEAKRGVGSIDRVIEVISKEQSKGE